MFPIAALCRVLGVSPSGYYAWSERPSSARAQADEILLGQIRAIHARSRGTYGARRIRVELRAQGMRCARKRVARLMRQAGLAGAQRRRYRGTTRQDRTAIAAPDLVQRDFTAFGPDQLWVADITYVPTGEGWLYLATVLDAWSRRIVGWAMGDTLRTELVVDALDMAVWNRRPAGVVHHSDRGAQYTSVTFSRRCAEASVVPSMGSIGDAYDKEWAAYYTSFRLCNAHGWYWARSRSRLPGCGFGRESVGGAKSNRPLSSARTARRTPARANRTAVARRVPSCAAISTDVSHPARRRCWAKLGISYPRRRYITMRPVKTCPVPDRSRDVLRISAIS